MKRWVRRLNREQRVPEVDAFLSEIEAVCKKHGMSISHEDSHGGFEVETFDGENIKWLKAAADARKGDL